MSIKDYQLDVDSWISQFTPSYWPRSNQVGQLMEEAGEVARESNFLDGVKKRKIGENEGSLGKELADVLFTVVCIANNSNIDLDKEWREMMEKRRYGRDNNRFEKK